MSANLVNGSKNNVRFQPPKHTRFLIDVVDTQNHIVELHLNRSMIQSLIGALRLVSENDINSKSCYALQKQLDTALRVFNGLHPDRMCTFVNMVVNPDGTEREYETKELSPSAGSPAAPIAEPASELIDTEDDNVGNYKESVLN